MLTPGDEKESEDEKRLFLSWLLLLIHFIVCFVLEEHLYKNNTHGAHH